MHHALRTMMALFALIGATGLAHADGEGGPGDSGVGGPSASASAANATGHMQAKRSHKARTGAKRASGPSDAASGAKADGPMGNGSVGKGG